MRRELMESKNGIESALANLIQLSSEKGFLVFDDIYDVADKWALSIRDVDYLSSSITTRGILIYDEAPVTNVAGSSEDDYDDYAQRDYEAVFNRVIELDPGLEDFINTVRAVVRRTKWRLLSPDGPAFRHPRASPPAGGKWKSRWAPLLCTRPRRCKR